MKRTRQHTIGCAFGIISALSVVQTSCAQHADIMGMPGTHPLDWKTLEAPILTDHLQLTFADRFVKAGEAYFSADSRHVIFQAVSTPAAGKAPDRHYSMYVADFVHDAAGAITSIENIRQVSHDTSANTCGWFHPTDPNHVLFASTIVEPDFSGKSGYQREGSRYAWAFPDEMNIVHATVSATGVVHAATPMFEFPGYTAEASWSKDGRHVLYAQVNVERSALIGRNDLDIWVYDTETDEHRVLVSAPGYDGGPFFSPDEQRICYRSDRRGNDMLQIFVSDLVYDDAGAIMTTGAEYQLTDGHNVNWAPYWHPSGEFLVYASSEVGHANYEVVAIRFDESKLAQGQSASEIDRVRMTYGNGADVLPVFSPDGANMMWTAQRGAIFGSEQRPSSQLWIASVNPSLTTDRLFRFISESDALRVGAAALELKVDWAAHATYDAQWNDLGWVVQAHESPAHTDTGWRFVLARDGRLLSSKEIVPGVKDKHSGGHTGEPSHSYHSGSRSESGSK